MANLPWASVKRGSTFDKTFSHIGTVVWWVEVTVVSFWLEGIIKVSVRPEAGFMSWLQF